MVFVPEPEHCRSHLLYLVNLGFLFQTWFSFPPETQAVTGSFRKIYLPFPADSCVQLVLAADILLMLRAKATLD